MKKTRKASTSAAKDIPANASRSFYIGENVEPKDVTAKFENGILQIAFPKAPQPKQPENKLISIA